MPLQPGEHVGPFRIVEQIGAGGAAIVYKAHDPLLDRFVAIKLIADASADRATVRREAATHKELTKDRPDLLVQLIDVVEDERGLMLISEYVGGESLEQRLTRKIGPMAEPRAVRILAQLAGALFFIHKRGMIHRDVKPANVLLAENDRVKLADFGLTVALADQRAMDAGTVRYMAPELLRGEPADGRADLYALGMIAYEMLAGRQRFDEAFALVLRDRRNAAMRWVKWHTNPRTAAPSLIDLNPQVHPRLAELVARLMDKDPQRRVSDANELLAALQRIHAPPGVAPPPQPRGAAVSTGGDTAPIPRARRGRAVAIAAAALLLVGAAGAGGYAWWRQDNARRTELAAHAQAMADAQAAFDAGQFSRAIAQYDRVLERRPNDVTAHGNRLVAHGRLALLDDDYEAAIRDFEAAIEADPRHRDALSEVIAAAKQHQAFADVLALVRAGIEAGRFDEAQQTIRQWLPLVHDEAERAQLETLSRTIADRRVRAAADATLTRARELAGQNRVGEAIALLEPALSQFSSYRALAEQHAQLVERRDHEAALTEARAAEAAGDTAAAIEAYRRAIALQPSPESQAALDRLESAALLAAGLAQIEAGDFAEAQRLLILALGKDEHNQQARDALGRMETVNQAQGFLAAGDAAMAAGDYDAAVRQFENAAQIGTDELITGRLREARVRKLLHDANAAMSDGDVDTAATLIAEARRLAPEHPMLTAADAELATRGRYHQHLRLGDAALNRSDFAAARTAYRRAQEALKTEEIARRLDDLEYTQSIAQARAFIDREEFTSALAMLRIALQIRDTEQARAMIAEVEGKRGE